MGIGEPASGRTIAKPTGLCSPCPGLLVAGGGGRSGCPAGPPNPHPHPPWAAAGAPVGLPIAANGGATLAPALPGPARVAEPVDARDLGSRGVTRPSSSLGPRTSAAGATKHAVQSSRMADL